MKRIISIFIIVALSLFATMEMYGYSKVVIRQDMDFVKVFAGKDTKYVIKQDIDLGERTVKIGEGSTLAFKGGSLSNGTVTGNNTRVKARNYEVFKRGYTRFRAYISEEAKAGAPPSLNRVHHDCIVIEGTWRNRKCGTKWTGLLNDSDEDVMLAIKNYITLHSNGTTVSIPKINALGYETTSIPGNHIVNFNNSNISYPDDLSIWEDLSIPIPIGAKPTSLESGYGLLSLNSNTRIENLHIDGKSLKRQDEIIRLGVSCIVSIGNSSNVLLKNVSLSNVLGPGITAQSGAENLTFTKCHFYNIGEHVIYSHQYKGFCRFDGCTFDTWDSERISDSRDGLDYIYKHTPPVDKDGISYEDLYRFDLSFNNCFFNNPQRVSSHNRVLGGFLTNIVPLEVKVINCRFEGEYPMFNPGGTIAEKSGKAHKMVVRGCDGAPFVYASKSVSNVIAEFYDCTNIPFRTVYAKRYDNCSMYLDLYEDNHENVTSSFEAEFSEPLVVKDCILTITESSNKVNHPIVHRPVVFNNSIFIGNSKGKNDLSLISINSDSVESVSFLSCRFNLSGYRLISNTKMISSIVVRGCTFDNEDTGVISVRAKSVEMENNVVLKQH